MKKTFLLALTCLFCAFCFAATPAVDASAEEEWDYVQTFEDAASVNADFHAFYLTKFMGILSAETVATEQPTNGHWLLDGGCVRRVNDVAPALDADSISILTLKRRYANFHMQIDIRQGTETVYWGAFCLRQDQPGMMFFEDGAGIYVEREGTLRIWGYELDGGPFECGKVEPYSCGTWYTYDITAVGNLFTVKVGESAPITIRVPWEYYREGHISLMAINNDAAFRDLKIKELPASENVTGDFPAGQAKPSATGEDSIDELAKLPPPVTPEEPKHDGPDRALIIGLSLGVGGGLLLCGGLVALLILKKGARKRQ